MFLSKFLSFKQTKESPLIQALETFSNVNITKLPSVYSSGMSIYDIPSYCKTIIDYTQLLEKINASLTHEELLYQRNIPSVIHIIPLRNFYADNNGMFIDTDKASINFITEVISFLKLYDSHERSSGNSFIKDKNLLTTQHITNNLIEISKGILWQTTKRR
jgi:hypothetical protein